MCDPVRNTPERGEARRSRRHRTGNGHRTGYSLIETMTVMVILGILTSIAVPRFGRSIERAKAAVAVANLRAILTAERIYWLEKRKYTSQLNIFVSGGDTSQYHGLLDRSIVEPGDDAPYRFEFDPDSDFSVRFRLKAIRQGKGSASYSGELIVTHEGIFDDNSQIRCGDEVIFDHNDID